MDIRCERGDDTALQVIRLRMKIALVSRHAYGLEGVPCHVTALARALATSHQVTIFSDRFEGLDGTAVRHRRVRAVGGSGFVFDVTFFITSTLMLWISRLKGKDQFDIIHSHHYGSPFFSDVITSHYCQREGIYQMRSQVDDMPSQNPLQRLQKVGWARVEKMLFGRRKSKALIVLSEAMKRDFIRHYETPVKGTYVIHSGVDCERYSQKNVRLFREEIRRLHSLTERDLVVLFVGGDWVRKGLAQAIEALPLLESCQVKLLILGHGDIATYQKMAEDLGVGEKLIFADPIQDNWKYYAASDVFLLPTLYEPFGLTILEAMAAGIPVLVSRNAGAAGLVQDGVNGLLLEDPRDITEIADKLKLLWMDGELQRRLGEKAHRTALQYTWSRVAQETLEVYQRVQDRHKVVAPRSRVPRLR